MPAAAPVIGGSAQSDGLVMPMLCMNRGPNIPAMNRTMPIIAAVASRPTGRIRPRSFACSAIAGTLVSLGKLRAKGITANDTRWIRKAYRQPCGAIMPTTA